MRKFPPIQMHPPTWAIPFFEHPGCRSAWATKRGVSNNFLFKTWGGIGDQICGEPAMRWAVTGGHIKGVKFTLSSPYPELFAHIPFDDVYNSQVQNPVYDDYLNFNMMIDTKAAGYHFVSHMLTNCVDFPAIASMRLTLPIADKNVVIKPPKPQNLQLLDIAANAKKYVAVHPGKHWESKTFPVKWWNRVLESIMSEGLTPVLIGASKTLHGGGFVEVNRQGCVDLFDKTTIIESVWLLQQLPVLICSDSSPLHMASSGNAFIGFVATAKHQDYITHWRKNLDGVNEWSWRMKHFNLGGMWDIVNHAPNSEQDIVVDKIDLPTLKKWLPEPEVFGPWCKEKSDEYFRKV
jgi:hypothetical protein